MIGVVLGATLLMVGGPTALPDDPLDSCLASATDVEAVLACHEQTSTSDSAVDQTDGLHASLAATYDYLWLPACPGAFPTTAGSSSVSCMFSASCAEPRQVRQSLWSIRRTDDGGRPVNEGWRLLGSESRIHSNCSRGDEGIDYSDIVSAVRRCRCRPASVEGAEVHAGGA